MKISVITLTNNSIVSIKETIKSIKSQTYKNIEKIWIDNESKDGTLEFLKTNQDITNMIGMFLIHIGTMKSSEWLLIYQQSDAQL
jgi:glycosyltransferase involved in cell wall biosynthesis